MKRYEIELDETIAEFFEEIAIIAERPIENLLSDALFKQVEIINLKVAELYAVDDAL